MTSAEGVQVMSSDSDHSPNSEIRELLAGSRSREDLAPECKSFIAHVEGGAEPGEIKREFQDLEQAFWQKTRADCRRRKAS